MTDSSVSVPPALASFAAGACAGLVVDVGLFPIDTIKTRLQSVGGLRANGGFKDVYNGLGVVMMGSVPGGAVFFATYDSVSAKLLARIPHQQEGVRSASKEACDAHHPVLTPSGAVIEDGNFKTTSTSQLTSSTSGSSMPSRTTLAIRVLAGSIAECSACLIRVPVELFKQRLQVGMHSSARKAWEAIVKEAAETSHCVAQSAAARSTVNNTTTTTITKFASPTAIARVLYKGYPITIFREVPFAMIQMPMYETLKAVLTGENNNGNTTNRGPFKSFFVGIAPGFISGGVSAVLTTPLDVTKTRIMTMKKVSAASTTDNCTATTRTRPANGGAVRLAGNAMRSIIQKEGAKALFKGGMTRAIWISSGGALFFGTYEGVKGYMLRKK